MSRAQLLPPDHNSSLLTHSRSYILSLREFEASIVARFLTAREKLLIMATLNQ